MAKNSTATEPGSPPPADQPRIFKAILRATDGAVLKQGEISEADAILERKAEREVVVCGNDTDRNRELAKAIEHAASGSYQQHGWHPSQPRGLNHFQPKARPPAGHTFYETRNRKARRR